MKDVSIIVAVDEVGGFGKNGKIPWNISEDLKHFQDVTKGSICIMGKATYQDMLGYAKKRWKTNEDFNKRLENKGPPEGEEDKRKPNNKEILPGRQSIVLSRGELEPIGAIHKPGLRQAVEEFQNDPREVFVIGGEKLFIEALSWCNKIYMTIVPGTYDCDRHFPLQVLQRHYTITAGEKTDSGLIFIEYTRNGQR